MRFVGRWLVCLDAGVLAVALGLAAAGRTWALFVAALVPLVLVPFSYARWRLDRTLAWTLASPRARALHSGLALTGVGLDVVMVAQLLTARTPGVLAPLHASGIGWVGPVWFSAHGLLLGGYAVGGTARALRRLARATWAVVARRRARAAATAPPSPERRAFLQRATLAAAGMPFVAAASGVPLSYDFRVEERHLPVPGWPRALDGLRVVHLSDIHVGNGMTPRRLRHVAELTQRCRPDLVAHTGDFLTHGSAERDGALYDALARIQAPFGQWACLGNHDYEHVERLARRLADAGVTVLRDGRRQLVVDGQPLDLAGLEFLFGPISRDRTYRRIFHGWGRTAGVPRLLLNHDPTAFGALPLGAADLVLSGHTHGGHVGIQLGRSHAITVVGLLGLPDQGFFARGAMRLFVTRCVGFYGYPMRVGIPPEIAVLVLRTPGPDVDSEPLRRG